jgi:hypothetical protein
MIGNISQPNQDNNQMGFLCFLFFFCFDGRGLGDFYDDDESRRRRKRGTFEIKLETYPTRSPCCIFFGAIE